ncbi:MAG: type I methionyl aminopeptidase [Bacteroidales bacterium]|nr:type I methionyl aminopeptidase [Bacteroidales bacterium]
MVFIKTEEEIELLKESNLLVSKTLAEVAKNIVPGISTLELDEIARKFILDHNAKPGFLGYKGYPNTLCTSVNHEVVHGIPSNYILKEGDIISIDCGAYYKGYYGDSAYTFPVGEIKEDVRKLLIITKQCLEKGVEMAVTGKRVGDISYAVQQHAESNGYSVVRELVGHGIGKNLHEAPEVPNYGRRGSGIKLKKGMVICIEPMINMGTRRVKQESDGWTVSTADKLPSAHFEYAIAVDNNPIVLSTFKFIEEVITDSI